MPDHAVLMKQKNPSQGMWGGGIDEKLVKEKYQEKGLAERSQDKYYKLITLG